MTALQKFILELLLSGYHIINSGSSGYRLRSKENVAVRKFHGSTFYAIKRFLRKTGNKYVISKKAVRAESGHTWVKQQYKKCRHNEYTAPTAALQLAKVYRRSKKRSATEAGRLFSSADS